MIPSILTIPTPYWVDEEGNFGGWLSEAGVAAMDAAYAEAIADTLTDDEAPNHEIDPPICSPLGTRPMTR